MIVATAAGAMKRTAMRLRNDVSGLALTEFAMSLPILCLLSITGIEFANYARAAMNLSQIALSAADNAGRIQDRIDEGDIESIFIGSRNSGLGIKFGGHGRVIMSMVEVNGQTGANAGQKITWQRCFGAKTVTSSYGAEGDGATDNTLAAGVGPAGNKIIAEPGTGVMFVEIVYDYQTIFPVTGFMVDDIRNKTLRYTAAFPVRERTNNALTNGFGLDDTEKRLCSRYSST